MLQRALSVDQGVEEARRQKALADEHFAFKRVEEAIRCYEQAASTAEAIEMAADAGVDLGVGGAGGLSETRALLARCRLNSAVCHNLAGAPRAALQQAALALGGSAGGGALPPMSQSKALFARAKAQMAISLAGDGDGDGDGGGDGARESPERLQAAVRDLRRAAELLLGERGATCAGDADAAPADGAGKPETAGDEDGSGASATSHTSHQRRARAARAHRHVHRVLRSAKSRLRAAERAQRERMRARLCPAAAPAPAPAAHAMVPAVAPAAAPAGPARYSSDYSRFDGVGDAGSAEDGGERARAAALEGGAQGACARAAVQAAATGDSCARALGGAERVMRELALANEAERRAGLARARGVLAQAAAAGLGASGDAVLEAQAAMHALEQCVGAAR